MYRQTGVFLSPISQTLISQVFSMLLFLSVGNEEREKSFHMVIIKLLTNEM